MDQPSACGPPLAAEATNFKACWAEYIRRGAVPADPTATLTLSVAELRRTLLSFFSYGLVHAERERGRIAALLPAPPPAPPPAKFVRRLPGMEG